MKVYTSFEHIQADLKRLSLERDIAWEELKLVKGEIKNDLRPTNWFSTILKLIGNYGLMAIIRKITSRK